MSSRYTRSGLRAVVVLPVLFATLVTLAAGVPDRPVGASTGSSPALTLLHQSPEVIQPGSSSLSLELGLGSSVPAGAVVELTLYNKLTSRSDFEQSLDHEPGSGVDATLSFPVASLGAGGGGKLLTVPVSTTESQCNAPSTLDLSCHLQTDGDAGVYPLAVAVLNASGGTVLGRFTTYLTFAGTNVGQPLRVALDLPLSAPVVLRHHPATPASALEASSAASLSAVRGLVRSLSQFPELPVTLEVSPQTLQNLNRPTDRTTLSTLAGLSADPQIHEIPAPPYVPVDLGALAGSGETTEIDGQLKAGATVLKNLATAGVSIGTTPGSETWVATSPVGASIASGLAQVANSLNVGTVRLVVPQSSVALPTQSLTWSSTFALSLGRSQPIEAAESDTQLTAHFDSTPGEPALEAQQLLADLAVVQSEAPNTTTPRGMVVVPPAGWTPNTAFDQELLGGLSNDPVVESVTLDNFFSQVGSFTPASQTSTAPHLNASGTTLGRGLARQITSARLRLTGFDSALPKGQAVLTQLDQALLASESSQLSDAGQRDGLSTFDWALNSQLQLIQISSERTITLTARNGLVPVTLLSSAPYPVHGVLTLQSPKLTFPNNATRVLWLDRSNNSIRIPVEVRTSGDLPVTATFSSLKDGLTITRAQMTIRSTATSLVGIVLTVAAVAVLLGWWARTVIAGRRRRRAAAASRETGQ